MKEELTLTKQALAKVLDENAVLKGSNSSKINQLFESKFVIN